ncbi:hypothetical protein A8990_13625 [Paenibacillus taihuensis]|uniref:Uncharacterized protein n=1 Tax=Paenibacillus taihuensis TaxID=1156355 RepID=A0A3D9QVG0_9BACL|nr:hypothetical protein A8990_13625 [Paenibacillus taihuensis]
MAIFIFVVGIILVLGVLRIDGMMKEHIKNDKRIIERLDMLINIQKDKKE